MIATSRKIILYLCDLKVINHEWKCHSRTEREREKERGKRGCWFINLLLGQANQIST